ncbi:hypothetical protein HMPREF1573_00400 [Gardnerella vaginalis JCP7276]|nr:hypothetical protein HMPREF1573_00400 [Gardnerella vaginalis JCP7276]
MLQNYAYTLLYSFSLYMMLIYVALASQGFSIINTVFTQIF